MRRIGIIGGGRFGSSLAQALAERGVEVLLLDRDRNVVDHMAGIVAKAMEGDATEEGTLEAARMEAEAQIILADASADNVEYHPAALYMKADCYRRLGRNADARTVAQALLARFPNCPYVDAARQLLKAIGPAPSS